MFHFVTDKEFLDASRAFCSRIMCRTRDLLHEEDINSQPVLVGSGARNLVTQPSIFLPEIITIRLLFVMWKP